ncbi:hypothetical protein BCV69DRAFT_279148 [Microstroma glucosiphilum]|uniref:HECT-type E3 ubiquitin transferase n=1 Tax=Pseudomicrostroma glucosiphilum TaxID=1684307 RepID=A0A316U113_9BASI|nr:hypothetical protein BCV69DRAFT_279148 [Pseudomicrostroma glucosiphilum]PWN18163.1 hypothetical protein BCV69DRAFT_279148 [Pseudomicrostroma glucosiphilum]
MDDVRNDEDHDIRQKPSTASPAVAPTTARSVWGKSATSPWLPQGNPASTSSSSSSSASPSPSASSSAFPALSASSSSAASKRSRHSPWHNALRGPAWNPNRTRLQELEERVLSRQLDQGSSRKKGTFGMKDLERTSDDSDVEVGNDSGGQTQMYGLSRVIVKDLSQPGATSKGKNKAKGQDFSAGGGPQIYGRHNTPWVQKGRARREGLAGDEGLESPSTGPSSRPLSPPPYEDSDGGESPYAAFYLEESPTGTRSIRDVIADCDRNMRAYYASLRQIQTNYLRDPIPRPLPDAMFPLYEKLSSDLLSPASVLSADWLDPTIPSEQSIKERLAALDSVQDVEASQVISRKIVLFCSRGEQAARTARFWRTELVESPCIRVAAALLRLLHICLVLGENRDRQGAFLRVSTLLATLFKEADRRYALEAAFRAFCAQGRETILIKAIARRLSSFLEQCRLASGDEALRNRIDTTAELLRLIHATADAVQRRDRKLRVSPAAYTVIGIAAHRDILLGDEHLCHILRRPEYALLHPIGHKLRLLRSRIDESKERARKEALWSSFYAPERQKRTNQERRKTAFSQPGQEGNVSNSMLLTINIGRESLLADTLDAFAELDSHAESASSHSPSHALQHELRIHFEGEEGVDSLLGGLRKEWFQEVVTGLLRCKTIVPAELEEGQDATDVEEVDRGTRFVLISPRADDEHAEALGIMLGLSLYHGVPLGIRLPDYVMNVMATTNQSKLPGLSGTYNEEVPEDETRLREIVGQNLLHLAQYRPGLVRSLDELLAWAAPLSQADSPIDDDTARRLFESTYSLNWTVTIPSTGDEQMAETLPLVRGGQHRPVTPANRISYVRALTDFHLYGVIRPQLLALRRGFARIWPATGSEDDGRAYLAQWHPSELGEVIQGDASPLRVAHLRKYVEVSGRRSSELGRAEDDEMLRWFWAAVAELEELEGYTSGSETAISVSRQKLGVARSLLRYVTSSSTLPLAVIEESAPATSAPGVTYRHTPPPPPAANLARPFRICLLDPPPSHVQAGASKHDGVSPAAAAASWPLPFASTCTETLFLPRYPSEEIAREKVGVLFGWLMRRGEDAGGEANGVGDSSGFDVAFGLR